MKGADGYMEIVLMGFPKKFFFRTNGPFKTKNGTFSPLWIHCKDYCVTMLHSERAQERHGNYGNYGNYINSFSEKFLYGAIWLFWPKIGISS